MNEKRQTNQHTIAPKAKKVGAANNKEQQNQRRTKTSEKIPS